MTVPDHDARREVEQPPEGHEVVRLECGSIAEDGRQGMVRIDRRIAEAGEVFQAAGEAFPLQSLEERPGQAADLLGARFEGSVADPVRGVGRRQVDDRREIQREADRSERAPRGLAEGANRVTAGRCQAVSKTTFALTEPSSSS